jgi:hypothetical protein
MKRLLLVLAVVACHSSPRASAIALSPEQRVQASLARWGAALESGTAKDLAGATDGAGQFAIAYGGTKLAASHVDGGAQAVESTVVGIFLMVVLQSMWPGVVGEPFQTWYAVVPTGSLGPALVAAGLAYPPREPNDVAYAFVPVPWDSTFGRLEEAQREHQAKLRERRAWTCRFVAIEKRVDADEPIFRRAAAVSTTMFAGWLREVEGVWLVRARCASGPALFAITARKDGQDRVLLAKLL